MRLQNFLNALIALDEENSLIINASTASLPIHIRHEAAELLVEIIEEVFKTIKINEVERKVLSYRFIHTEPLKNFVKIIKDGKPKKFEFKFDENNTRIVDPIAIINKLEKDIDDLSKNQKTMSIFGILAQIDLFMDSEFNEALMSFPPNSPTYNKLHKIITDKLDECDDDQIMIAWSRVIDSFIPSETRNGFKNYTDIIPKTFWNKNANLKTIRDNYARFIVEYKPLTVRRMVEEGHYLTPSGYFGIPNILSKSRNHEQVTHLDILTIRLVSKLAAMYTKISFREIKDLAKSINADPSSLIFIGEYFIEYTDFLRNHNKDIIKIMISITKRIIALSPEINFTKSNLGIALWQYKLGREVTSPIDTPQIINGKKNEIALQKELCKFLIERGFTVFGRTFGRNQIDLYTKDEPSNEIIIEAKVFKKSPTQLQIRRCLTQLLSYMDQIAQPYGVLIIYNCSKDLIISPKAPIKGRIWVVSVNIGEAPPSGRNRSCEIIQSDNNEELIYLLKNNSNVND